MCTEIAACPHHILGKDNHLLKDVISKSLLIAGVISVSV